MSQMETFILRIMVADDGWRDRDALYRELVDSVYAIGARVQEVEDLEARTPLEWLAEQAE